jgi:hypothetical protein
MRRGKESMDFMGCHVTKTTCKTLFNDDVVILNLFQDLCEVSWTE